MSPAKNFEGKDKVEAFLEDKPPKPTATPSRNVKKEVQRAVDDYKPDDVVIDLTDAAQPAEPKEPAVTDALTAAETFNPTTPDEIALIDGEWQPTTPNTEPAEADHRDTTQLIADLRRQLAETRPLTETERLRQENAPGTATSWTHQQWDYHFAGGDVDQPSKYPAVPLSSITRKPVEWLWHPYIPNKKATIVEGDPEVGKSWLTLAIACAISNGYTPGRNMVTLPDGPGNVLLISAEDDLADTVGPRVDLMSGDSDRIYAIPLPDFTVTTKNRPPQLVLDDDGLREIEKLVLTHNPRLVIIDPLAGYIGRDVDTHRPNEVRPIMAGLAAIAVRQNTAIIVVRHLTKARGRGAITAGAGSIDFAAAVRSILLAGYYQLPDPDDPLETIIGRAIVQTKNNVAAHGPPIGYDIDPDRGLLWDYDTPDGLNASAILGDYKPPKPRGPTGAKRQAAAEWLLAELADGPKPTKTIRRLADKAGHTERTLIRARDELNVDYYRDDHNAWYLRLPGGPEEPENNTLPLRE